jgi:uncharacterized membrane protein
MDDAHGQTVHRQGLESRHLDASIANSRRGQVFGFVLAMTAIVGGMVLIALGKDLTGAALAIGSLATLVGVFIYNQRSQNRELRENREAFPAERDSPSERQSSGGEGQ